MSTPEPVMAAVALWRGDLGTQLELLAVLGWAGVLGLLIGLERDLAHKAAGLRTHALVAITAAAVTGVSAGVIAGGDLGDPTRGLHAVITGIGFLGAGAILQPRKEGTIGGLTTAASIMWAAAAGGAVALGYGFAATIGTLGVIGMLRAVGWWKHGRNGDDDDD